MTQSCRWGHSEHSLSDNFIQIACIKVMLLSLHSSLDQMWWYTLYLLRLFSNVNITEMAPRRNKAEGKALQIILLVTFKGV